MDNQNNVYLVTCNHNQSFNTIFLDYESAKQSILYSYYAVKDLKIDDSIAYKLELKGTNWQGLFFTHTFNIQIVTPLTGIHHL
jgi:hypothetical protein